MKNTLLTSEEYALKFLELFWSNEKQQGQDEICI
jgi:hypothetical protein